MKEVLEQYAKHITRLMHKESTPARRAGISYYTNAAIAVSALISQPRPAWYDFKFDKKLY
jgi:hypothetical protein